ncbi:metallo-beta-lactamase domain-containing protein 1-like isoform X2 [Haliotis rubra]|uniref:metallo-beta-lactamase domain-containing protein 1-like isoform X2 n=1 Tax=Haliotis rubra TaxID=36100 RepID=UPI001EE4F6D5|nr:metallo-beta-lactamase domain-containing protein 1-like isoform X2 [Haliotis rubra]
MDQEQVTPFCREVSRSEIEKTLFGTCRHVSSGLFPGCYDNCMMYEVIVLKEGYSVKDGPGHQKACGSITLLRGAHTILVDTGNPWDKDLIIEGLHEHSLLPEHIEYVVCTNGHTDKVGNLNLFPGALHIVSYDVSVKDRFLLHQFGEGIPYEIDEHVEVVPTPGHTGSDVSVIVKNTALGTVAVTGDLFERFEDLDQPHLWQENSEQPEQQEQSRIAVLRQADYIVPGHGPMFQVPPDSKKQLRVVVYEEHMGMLMGDLAVSQDYSVWEEEED